MMKHYLTLVLRYQFNLFYRFGYTYIPKSQLIEFEGIILDTTKEHIIKQFSSITPFEYDEEYLILHLETTLSNESEIVQFEITDIVAVYPLSEQAKISIESKIDQRIRLEKPIFESVLPSIEKYIENKEIKKAISALWIIFKIETPLEKYISNIGLENILIGIEFRKQGKKANKIQNGNYWDYLIAYDRFDYFPNSALGYFYDAGQIFAYSTGRPTFEGSGIHAFLEELNSTRPELKISEIINLLETEDKPKSYVSQCTVGDIKHYIIAPLYLMLRDEIRKSDDFTQTKIFKNLDLLKKYGDSFYYAVILLGAFFGFRKFYDAYYDVLNLRFYKEFNEHNKQIVNYQPQENIDITSSKEHTLVINKDVYAEERLNKIKVEKKVEYSNAQDEDNNDAISGITNQYQKIIDQALNKKSEIKFSEIVATIKEQTSIKVNNRVIKGVAKQMKEIEIIKIGRSDGLRRKSGTLFN